MPGIYGDLRNLARNPGFEMWTRTTSLTTSDTDSADAWAVSFGASSTFAISRATTGMDLGRSCLGMTYTHVATSDIHQVTGMVDDLKGQVVSFGIKVATTGVRSCRPYVSTDGGTTRTYGNYHTGSSATVYETLKVEGIAVPNSTAATFVWFGLELYATCTLLIDSAQFNIGSAVDTSFPPSFARSPIWTITSGSTNRAIDPGVTATTAVANLSTLIRDLQALGILGGGTPATS